MKRECRRGELGARELGGSLSGRTAVGALEKRDVLRSRRNVRVRPLRNGWAGRCSQKGGGGGSGWAWWWCVFGGGGGYLHPKGDPRKKLHDVLLGGGPRQTTKLDLSRGRDIYSCERALHPECTSRERCLDTPDKTAFSGIRLWDRVAFAGKHAPPSMQGRASPPRSR